MIWVLILLAGQGGLTSSSISVDHIEGFKTKQDCIVAGDTVKGNGKLFQYVCVKQ